MISMVGLILSLAAVSQAAVVVQSYQNNLFREYLIETEIEDVTLSRSDFIVNINLGDASRGKTARLLQNATRDIIKLGKTATESLGFPSNFVEREIYHFRYPGVIMNNNFEALDIGNGFITSLDNESFHYCQKFLVDGTLPQNFKEVVIIIDSEYLSNVQVGDELLVSGKGTKNDTVTVTGIIAYDYKNRTLSSFNGPRNTFWDYFDWPDIDVALLTSQNSLINLINLTYSENETLQANVYGQINIDHSQLDAFNLEGEKIRLNQFRHSLGIEALRLGYTNFVPNSYIIARIYLFENKFNASIVNIWLFILPTLVATLILANFSQSLLQGRKQAQIGILKTRGASFRQIFFVLIGEAVFATFFSIWAGIFVSLPYAYLTLMTEGFLNFSGRPMVLALPLSVFPITFFFGAIFAVILNLRSTYRIAKMDISETLSPKIKGVPLWKKYNLDAIMLGLGLLGYFSMAYFTNIFATPDPGLIILFILGYFFAFIFGVPSPILIIIGGAMMLARLLPILLRRFAGWIWKFEGGIIAFSFQNVLYRMTHASRAVLLISVVIAFNIAFITIPYNNDINAVDNKLYQMGGDLVVTSNSTTVNPALLKYLENNITGIEYVSPVSVANSSSMGFNQIRMLGIDIKTYAQTAFFREDFLNQDFLSSLSRLDIASSIRAMSQGDLVPKNPSLETLLSGLESNNSVLVQEDYLNRRNLDHQGPLTVILNIYNETTNREENKRFDFEIEGTFKSWPLLVKDMFSIMWGDTIPIVANLSTVLGYANTSLFSYSSILYLIRAKPGFSTIEIKKQINKDTGLYVESIGDFKEDYVNSPTREVLITVINGSILILMTVVLFTILMFGYSQLLERNKEIGVERALGMSLSQTSLLFVIEGLILVLFGTLVGVVLGVLISQVYLMTTLLAQSLIFPQSIIIYPWDLFTGIACITILVGGISSLIPAYLATRVKISDVLRGE